MLVPEVRSAYARNLWRNHARGRTRTPKPTWTYYAQSDEFHRDGKPTIRPLKRKPKHYGVFGDWIAKHLLEDGYNIRTVRKLLFAGR